MANILVFNKKGGVGKSSIAITIAARLKYNLVTNDAANGIRDIYSNLLVKKSIELIEISMNQKELSFSGEKGLVFDFGGFIDKRLSVIAGFVDCCIIPICYESKADVDPSIKTIIELSAHCKEIIIVINKTDRDKAEELEKVLKNNFKHSVLLMPKTKYMNRLADESKTVFELSLESGLNKHLLKKTLSTFEQLFEKIGVEND